ncbi:MAG: hypothetical protein JST80_10255 [Bdellovibrionales bacterium]|nr:hypothetical protein [Bdellovibrionales bacterium]
MSELEPQHHVVDLIEFYAGGAVSQRNLDLIKHRVEKKVAYQKDNDLKIFVSYREALKELALIHRKRVYQPTIYQNFTNPIFKQLMQLQPKDLLILLSEQRYGMPDEELSIIIEVSKEHILFRRNQLAEMVTHKRDELKKVCTAPVATLSEENKSSQNSHKNISERFRSLPLPARFLIETGMVLSVLIFLMWLIPEVRNRYENSIQKRINDYLIESTISDAPAPEGTSKSPKIVQPPPEETRVADTDEPDVKIEDAKSKKPLKVNDGETWRFSFTGTGTNDITTEIQNILKKIGQDQVKSTVSPGGIQFDFYIPTKELANLKSSLEQMTAVLQRKAKSNSPDAPTPISMSWYKKKNMIGRKINAGHVEVVIWVSTL